MSLSPRLQSAVNVGNDPGALFSGPVTPQWTLVSSYDPTKPSTLGTTLGVAGVGPAATATGNLQQQIFGQEFRRDDLAITGPVVNGSSGSLVIKKGQQVLISFLGTVNTAGSTTLQIVERLTNGDSCRCPAYRQQSLRDP